MINENINRVNLHEILEKVGAAKDTSAKRDVLKHYDTKTLRYFLKGSFDDTIEWMLPKGTPPFKENKYRDAEHVRTHVVPRFKYFVKGGPPVKEAKRELMWIRMLESITWEDAYLLCDMKNGDLAGKYKGFTKKLVMDAFPGLIKK